MGRKNKYETNVKPNLEKIKVWYEDLTEAQIADKLHVSIASWENYKKQYTELAECLQAGREELIEDLKASLKKKAKGFHYKETKKIIRDIGGKRSQVIEEYDRYSPPDTGAIHLLLKNLDDNWRNDDKATMDLKREKMELEKSKNETW